MKNTFKNLILSSVLVAGFAVPAYANTGLDPEVSKTWDKAESVVEDIVETRSSNDFNSVNDMRDAQVRRLANLLDEAVSILSASPAREERKKLMEIHERIGQKQSDISNLRFMMASAPEDQGDIMKLVLSQVGIGKKTKADYQNDINDLNKDIEDLRKEEAEVRVVFAKNLEKMGIHLTDGQLEGLLSMATADDIVDMQAVFDNMKAINNELLAATIRSDESIEVAQRYYGIYTVMLEIAMYMHDDFIDRVDNEYLAKITEIETNASSLKKEAQKMVRSETDSNLKAVLQNNVKAQDLTVEAAGIYRKRLNEQRSKVVEAAHKVRRQHQVAVNTYKTVTLSADLVTMMRGTGKTFEALMTLEIPALRPFESMELQNEFDRITNEIKGVPVS